MKPVDTQWKTEFTETNAYCFSELVGKFYYFLTHTLQKLNTLISWVRENEQKLKNLKNDNYSNDNINISKHNLK